MEGSQCCCIERLTGGLDENASEGLDENRGE